MANGTTNANEFQIYMNNIQLTGSYISTNYYFDFETNGVANTGITAWGGIGVETNPNPGSSFAGQSAFDFAGFTPGARIDGDGLRSVSVSFRLLRHSNEL